jgi:hypothetical protein
MRGASVESRANRASGDMVAMRGKVKPCVIGADGITNVT